MDQRRCKKQLIICGAVVAVVLLLSTYACYQVVPADDPYAKWKSMNIHDYTIDQALECYCVNGGEKMRVTVVKDSISSVLRLSDHTIIANHNCLSIDSLFNIIRNPGKDSIVAQYDQLYGFPTVLDINPQQHPVDGGVLYRSSNFRSP